MSVLEVEYGLPRMCDVDPIERSLNGRPLCIETVLSVADEARVIEAERASDAREAKVQHAIGGEVLHEAGIASDRRLLRGNRVGDAAAGEIRATAIEIAANRRA